LTQRVAFISNEINPVSRLDADILFYKTAQGNAGTRRIGIVRSDCSCFC
jgi:hypothetical protein